MPGVHAKLSASSAHRWLMCPGSVTLSEQFPETTSEFAEEGTLAHSVAEQKLQKFLKHGRKKIPCEDKSMDEYTDAYRDYVVEVFNSAKKKDAGALLLVEERLDFSPWVPDGFGTGDAVIIANGTCHIIDLKYGKGVSVSAEDNPQCRLYALGAINSYDLIYDFDTVCTHIFQPRIDNISTEENSVADLLDWGESYVKPRAAEADSGTHVCCSGDHCRFCLAKAVCRQRAEDMLAIGENTECDPDMLSDSDISKIVPKLDAFEKWAKDLREWALNQMLAGHAYEGLKVVEGRSNRIITDETGLIKELNDRGYPDEKLYKPAALKTITDLEKLVGKKDFAIIAAGHIDKPKGKPAVALISDKRPEYVQVSAEEAFKDIPV